MMVTELPLAGLKLIEPQTFSDNRGHFFEAWSRRRFSDSGLPVHFVQDNVARSVHGTLRGLHLQHPHGQGKLVMALTGSVLDVAVDVRRGSPSFGRSLLLELSEDNRRQLYIPPGFAHGYYVQSESAHVLYKCTQPYHPESELGVRFDDPELDIAWPTRTPLLSPKDERLPRLAEIPRQRLPVYEPAP
jgi:dTDP-4-dehydrorhamnose 3,5-epimerase